MVLLFDIYNSVSKVTNRVDKESFRDNVSNTLRGFTTLRAHVGLGTAWTTPHKNTPVLAHRGIISSSVPSAIPMAQRTFPARRRPSAPWRSLPAVHNPCCSGDMPARGPVQPSRHSNQFPRGNRRLPSAYTGRCPFPRTSPSADQSCRKERERLSVRTGILPLLPSCIVGGFPARRSRADGCVDRGFLSCRHQ